MIPTMDSSPSPSPSSQGSGPIRHDRLLIAAGILVFLLVFGELWRRISQASDLRALEHRIGAQVTQLADESVRVDTLIAGAQSDEAVAEWARGEGKMVKPGEILVVPQAATVHPPLPETPPAEIPMNLPNWRIWWEWLMGEE
jgi:cell division protein FtsB